jgi:hypothetical protein
MDKNQTLTNIQSEIDNVNNGAYSDRTKEFLVSLNDKEKTIYLAGVKYGLQVAKHLIV